MQAVKRFRNQFRLEQSVRNWFPGHMFRGMQDIMRLLKNIDCVIEIHDARVPFTGRNTRFRSQVASARPHLLVLNKMDLTDPASRTSVINRIRKSEGIDQVVYTNLKSQSTSSNKVIPIALQMVRQSDRYRRGDSEDINLLVLGIPNVGKSTFINKIRNHIIGQKQQVARVGDRPGVTRAVQEKIKISFDPLVYIYDTPGIMQPTFVDRVEDPLKLAACGLLPNQVIGNEIIADFILYWLNKHEQFEYTEKLGLSEPSDNIHEVLYKLAMDSGFLMDVRMPGSNKLERRLNVYQAAERFNEMFRNNLFGKHNMDCDMISKV